MTFDVKDYQDNHLLAAVGYVIFFLPLLLKKDSRLCKYAANQGLLGLIAFVVVVVAFWFLNLLLGWIPLVGLVIRIAGWLCRLAVVACMVYYGWRCYTGKVEPLPYIGGINLLN